MRHSLKYPKNAEAATAQSITLSGLVEDQRALYCNSPFFVVEIFLVRASWRKYLTRIFRAIETLYGYTWSAIASEQKYCYAKFSNMKYLWTKITQIAVYTTCRCSQPLGQRSTSSSVQYKHCRSGKSIHVHIPTCNVFSFTSILYKL